MKKRKYTTTTTIIAFVVLSVFFYFEDYFDRKKEDTSLPTVKVDIPEYNNEHYMVLNNNKVFFELSDYSNESFEEYSDLDELGRCQTAVANIGKELMPTEERGSIGMVKPTGWHTIKYDFIDGKYLYNRCHLIAYQLTGENANKNNLITCTRQMNIKGMLPFEEKVAEYIKKTNNHVMYRVTPLFHEDELLARGVVMEAKSVEDSGVGLEFNVFVYNVQENIEINYADGESSIKE